MNILCFAHAKIHRIHIILHRREYFHPFYTSGSILLTIVYLLQHGILWSTPFYYYFFVLWRHVNGCKHSFSLFYVSFCPPTQKNFALNKSFFILLSYYYCACWICMRRWKCQQINDCVDFDGVFMFCPNCFKYYVFLGYKRIKGKGSHTMTINVMVQLQLHTWAVSFQFSPGLFMPLWINFTNNCRSHFSYKLTAEKLDDM